MAPAESFNVLCRLLWITSLALDTRNSLTVELSTPRSVAPNGLAFCFTNSENQQQASTVSVPSLIEGGSFAAPAAGRQIIGLFSQTSSLHQSTPVGPINLPFITFGDPGVLLASASQISNRYALEGVVPVAGTGGWPPNSQSSSSSNKKTPGWGGQASGSCLVLSGPWQANTRYVLTLNITNPGADSISNTALPALWMVPLTQGPMPGSERAGEGSQPPAVQLLVRGSTTPAWCDLRPKAAAALPRMFSACAEAQQHGLVVNITAGSSSPSTRDCLAALKAYADSNPAAVAATFPFNVPPLADSNTLSMNLNPDAACPAGSVLSGQLGGECIDCGNGTRQAQPGGGTSCQCYPGFAPHMAGMVACGQPISRDWNVSDAAALANQLCAAYSSYRELMMQGQLADRVVHAQYLAAFQQQATFLLDPTAVALGAEDFWRSFVVDDRMPTSPTRRGRGIGPDCRSCRHATIKDIYSGEMLHPNDDRFLAVNTFRLIGYLLHTTGHPCTTLWDPDDPLKWTYGRYDTTMCA